MVRKIYGQFVGVLTSHNTHFTKYKPPFSPLSIYIPYLLMGVWHVEWACVVLHLYIVVLYQNGCKCLLRKRIGPVREKRRGLLWVVAVPVERVQSGRYAIWGRLLRVGRSRWLYVVLGVFGVTSQNIMEGYSMTYNALKARPAILAIYNELVGDFPGIGWGVFLARFPGILGVAFSYLRYI